MQAAGTVSRQVADRIHQERLASPNTAEHSGRMLRCHWSAPRVLHASCSLHQDLMLTWLGCWAGSLSLLWLCQRMIRRCTPPAKMAASLSPTWSQGRGEDIFQLSIEVPVPAIGNTPGSGLRAELYSEHEMPATECKPDDVQVTAWQCNAAAEPSYCLRTHCTLAEEALPPGTPIILDSAQKQKPAKLSITAVSVELVLASAPASTLALAHLHCAHYAHAQALPWCPTACKHLACSPGYTSCWLLR